MFTPDPQTILIIDDSMANILALKDALNEYSCISATSGRQGLALACAKKQPDLILLDIIMDGMDGYEVCEKLKNNTLTREIPVVFLTSQSKPESLVRGFNVGAADFISKPFNVNVLKARVANQLKYKKTLDNNIIYLKNIEEIYDTITDSMYYAQQIQRATLPHEAYLKRVLDNYFIIYKPRDIVSGDFYLVHQIENKKLLVAADCTGHGVPGALMSMMSMALINEIVNVGKIHSPNEILNKLRSIIINTFNRDGANDISDGLDASIALIDPETDTMEYAGANSPIYLIRDGELIDLKGDRMPVGIYPSQTPFTNHTINLKKGDNLYMFSDGYADQFGGETKRKMMLRHFKKLLVANSHLPMDIQKKKLSNYFMDWMEHNEQVDDVLLFGYRYTPQ